MSAPEERDPAQGGQDRADGGADCDPRLFGVPVVPAEGSDPIVSVAAFLVSQTVTRALQEIEGGEEAAQPAVEEDGDIWSAEQEEDMEAGREEEEDQDYEGEEEEDEDEPGDHAEERVNISMKTGDEAQETEGEEKKAEGVRNEEPEKGPENDLDPEDRSL
ncbi:parathymosin-like [Diceros bicornis minor]|uniref:parathymosin-like n=1 Tax=Diceros bicornis minor TaxID=77932 RepID=UPI0026EDB007|nr:parathymosin-like [Diceros bicornis minor]